MIALRSFLVVLLICSFELGSAASIEQADMADDQALTSATLIARLSPLVGDVNWDFEAYERNLRSFDSPSLRGRMGEKHFTAKIDKNRIAELLISGKERPVCQNIESDRIAEAIERARKLLKDLELPDSQELGDPEAFKSTDIIHVDFYRYADNIRFQNERIRFMFSCDDLTLEGFFDRRTQEALAPAASRKSESEIADRVDAMVPQMLERLYVNLRRKEPYRTHRYIRIAIERAIVHPEDNSIPVIPSASGPPREVLIYVYHYGPPEGEAGVGGELRLWMDVETGDLIGGDYHLSIIVLE